MSRWKTLPNELDPEIKEFVSQLRWLVDQGGLGGAALADRTGYGRASWESYLAGRLLAPKGAAVALAEAAGTSPGPIITMWELAERAWSRAELGHEHAVPGSRSASGTEDGTPGVPRIPAQPKAAEAERRGGAPGESSGGNSWGLAGYQGPSRASGRPGGWPEPVRIPGEPEPLGPEGPHGPLDARSPQGTQSLQGPQSPQGTRNPQHPQGSQSSQGSQGSDPVRPSGPDGRSGYRQPALMFLGGFATVLLIILGVFHFTGDHGGGKHEAAPERPARSPGPKASLPPGVKCSGSDCVGKDAESMGCSGDQVTTAQTVTLGTTTLEVRYSKVCGAAWGRITGAVPGDEVQVTGARGKVRETRRATQAGDTIAYTPMIAAKDPAQATACATLASGRTGCTR
ncbi:DUF2690 domain-containing protein [Streptomyces malaysiense]|uniref:HTH cro/C1-type domain-containing protein n=1 Tax=Streptomyces malaysiense TaxID=1428626 RepID=A0A1J4Q580_9ACTN|nr:DUF2690 domain-containing protein [Streptomyces malaysiense]OIK28145.1 hypothetical protein VT52_007795 [Streptomyces malaysiense]